MHEGQKHSIQLDYIPDLTVDKISSLISTAFCSKDKLLLMTNDNNILHPDIKFADLLLINPGKYKCLKTFASKEYSLPPSSQMGFKNNNFPGRHRDPLLYLLRSIPFLYRSADVGYVPR